MEYPEGKEVREIRVGQSGADVYEIDGKTILKAAAEPGR